MKRLSALLVALFFVLPLMSCAEAVTDPTGQSVEIGVDMLGPLFRIGAVEGQSGPETCYYPTESGTCYVARAERGYQCGYFMLPDLISNEAIFTCREKPSPVFDLGEEMAACFADGKLFLLDLTLGSSTPFELHGKMAYTDILLGADGAFYYENERFLLTADLAFSPDRKDITVTERVVMPKEKLLGYTGMLGVSADGERMYYTYELDGEVGYGYFGIGYRAELLGRTPLAYDTLQRISGTSLVLFEEPLKEGKKTYTVVDFDTAQRTSISVAAGAEYDSLTVNLAGTHLLALSRSTSGKGGHLDLYTLKDGVRVKRYALAELAINESIAMTKNAKYLIVGQFDDGAAYEDAGGETVTRIEVGP